MEQKNYDMAHFHMLLTEYMTRTYYENADRYEPADTDTPAALLNTPYGLFRYIRTCAKFHIELLCAQLKKLDPLTEIKMYQMLSSLSESAYNLWEFSDECTSR